MLVDFFRGGGPGAVRRALTLLAAVGLSAIGASAQARPEVQGAAELRAKLVRQGRMSVIAEIARPPGAALSAAAVAATSARLAKALAGVGVAEVNAIGTLPFVELEVNAQQLDALLATGAVVGVSANGRVKANLSESAPLVAAPAAWQLGARGAGKAVVVVDSGVQSSHPFLGGRVVRGLCTADDCGSGVLDQPGAGEPNAGCWHGTHVAGIVAGSSASLSGVAPAASIISLRVLKCDSGWDDDILRGLDYVATTLAAQHSIAAVNMSLGNGESYGAACDEASASKRAYAEVMSRLKAQGIATVVAAGNDGSNTGISSPACIDAAIAVGSTTKSDTVSYFSNTAPNVDALAPGSGIYSSVGGGGFVSYSGTSMAAPHVAGAFAALRSRVPGATVDQIEQALEATGKAVTDGDSGITKPRIDVAQALYRLGVSPGPVWHAQESFGGALHSTPVCVATGATQIDCWTTQYGGTLNWWRYDGASAPTPVNLGGQLAFPPSCLSAGGSLHCFAPTLGQRLAQISYTGGGWGPWVDLGGRVQRKPSCVTTDGAKIGCVALGADSRLHYRGFNGKAWGKWVATGGSARFVGVPTCFARAGGIDCLATGTDKRLYHARVGADQKWSAPKSLGGSVVAPGSCIPSGANGHGCFFLGTDRALKQIRLVGATWGSWANLGGALAAGPSCLRIGNVETHCFATGLDGTLQQLVWKDGAWQPWRSLGRGMKEQPSCVAPSGARMDCFARGMGNQLQHIAYN